MTHAPDRRSVRAPWPVLVLLVFLPGAAQPQAAAPGGERRTFSDRGRGFTLQYPADWSATEATPYVLLILSPDMPDAGVSVEVRPDMVIGPWEKAVDAYLDDMKQRVPEFALHSRRPIERRGFTHGVELAWSSATDKGRESVTELQFAVSPSKMIFVHAYGSPAAWEQQGERFRAVLASVARYP